MDINRINSVAIAVDAGDKEPKFHARPEVTQAVTAVNSAKLFGQDSELTFAMDRETRRTVVRLVERDSRKVIRQIPSEEVLALARHLSRAAHPR